MSAAPNSIIIYRNRSEMEIDNLIWNGDGSAAAALGYVIAGAIMFVAITMILQKVLPFRFQKYILWISIPLAIPAGVLFGKLFGFLLLWI
jgi:hypothetical protein